MKVSWKAERTKHYQSSWIPRHKGETRTEAIGASRRYLAKGDSGSLASSRYRHGENLVIVGFEYGKVGVDMDKKNYSPILLVVVSRYRSATRERGKALRIYI